MQRPSSMTEEQCADIPACFCQSADGITMTITKWELTEEELQLIIQTKAVYLGVIGEGMPPVFLEVKNLFENSKQQPLFDPENN